MTPLQHARCAKLQTTLQTTPEHRGNEESLSICFFLLAGSSATQRVYLRAVSSQNGRFAVSHAQQRHITQGILNTPKQGRGYVLTSAEQYKRRCRRVPSTCYTSSTDTHSLRSVLTEEISSYRMSAIQNLQSFDPFADASKGNDWLPAGTEDSIHIRIQQRNGRKTLTTVQGISDDYDKKKLVKAFKKKFACNGTVVEHPEYGEVIQLQGDQRKNACQFLVEVGLVKDDQLKVHGF
ncbi:unnamed protein product [Ranitomeya imitator]|uniref:SUI1 domain-containing protein n=2 Tax=Ranitomeya imitator TaxID=111125 RepID=A0ABN9LJS6_9NEOB|nr:unnamed protein product [Ranitomeya imitator]